MRIGVMTVIISLAALLPGSLMAEPTSADASAAVQPAPAATATQDSAPAANTRETVVVKTSAPSETSSLDEIVCRANAPTTGTRLGASRECHSVRDWNRRQADAQRILQQTQAMGLEGHAGPKGN